MTSPLYVNNDQIIKSNIFLAYISVFVSLFTIILYLSKKTLHTFKLGMMFGIAVSEMINGIGYILSFCLLGVTKDTIETIDNSIVCNMQRFFTIYPDLSTSLFLIFFAYSTYDLIQNNSNKLEKKTKNIIIIGFTAPLIITIFFLFILIRNSTNSIKKNVLGREKYSHHLYFIFINIRNQFQHVILSFQSDSLYGNRNAKQSKDDRYKE